MNGQPSLINWTSSLINPRSHAWRYKIEPGYSFISERLIAYWGCSLHHWIVLWAVSTVSASSPKIKIPCALIPTSLHSESAFSICSTVICLFMLFKIRLSALSRPKEIWTQPWSFSNLSPSRLIISTRNEIANPIFRFSISVQNSIVSFMLDAKSSSVTLILWISNFSIK